MFKYLFIFLVLIFSSCTEDSTSEPNIKDPYFSDKDAGLILVVETKYDLGPYTEFFFGMYKEEFLTILSDMFEVKKEDMLDMTMSETIEAFGEDWQIRAMKEAVEGHYKDIKVLTDDDCSGEKFMSAIDEFAQKGYYIDVLFSLHASEDKWISFLDRNYHIDEFTQFLKTNNYHLRSLYQTCCFGQNFIKDWTNSGMSALNGSINKNDINMFSPVYFLEEWVGNKLPFKEAVQKAYDREIAKLKTYNDILPVESFFLTKEKLENSKMLTGGIDDGILWNEFPGEYAN